MMNQLTISDHDHYEHHEVNISDQPLTPGSSGLKTGLYYLRTKAAADAIKFTVDVDALKRLGA